MTDQERMAFAGAAVAAPVAWEEVVTVLVIALVVVYGPFVYILGVVGSWGKDAVTEQRIRTLFRENLPGVAVGKFEGIVGPLDADALVDFMGMSLRDAYWTELANYAVAYWKRHRSTRVYEDA